MIINGTNKYFIYEEGYCTKLFGRKEVRIPINLIRGVPKVKIQNKKLNLVNLMIEHFIGDISGEYKVGYKVEDGMLPLSNIRITKYVNSTDSKDDELIFKYDCKRKCKYSNSRNSRTNTLTPIDILNALKRTEYRCHYCNDKINPNKWHLDHVYPLSKGGLNTPTNITPACPQCNMMKSSMGIDELILRCKKIIKNFN